MIMIICFSLKLCIRIGLLNSEVLVVCCFHFDFHILLFLNADMIGLVTGVSTEKNYAKDGQTTRKIELELTDDKYEESDV